MKKYCLIILVALVAFGCDPTNTDEYKKLKAQNDSLATVTGKNDETIIDFVSSLNEVQQNLETIKQKENIITVNTTGGVEKKEDIKAQINQDIQTIYELMQDNKATIKKLNKRLKKSNVKIKELEEMLALLTRQMKDKDLEIEQLKAQLEKLNIVVEDLMATVDTLSNENENKQKVINDQTDEINTAFYVYGSAKELKDHQVITKEGGFIGLGRMEKLMEDFNKEYFTKVDIRKLKSIPIFKKKARLITTHPSDSYRFYGEKKVDSLIIINPKKFWTASKYLVVVVE